MFITLIVLFIIGVCAYSAFKQWHRHNGTKNTETREAKRKAYLDDLKAQYGERAWRYDDDRYTKGTKRPDYSVEIAVSIMTFVAWAIFAGCVTGSVAWDASDIKNSQYVVEAKQAQRDELLAVFEDVLENEDFVQLMEASVPADVAFLKTNPEVSGFLLARADKIVAVNAVLYAEQNRLLDSARTVCNVVENPLLPTIPFMTPDCSLGHLQESFKSEGES